MTALVAPWVGVAHMLAHPFMRNALMAGTAIALVAGLIGYFVVLRSQVFAADALSHVAFAGALGALAFGISLRAGLYGACIAFGLLLALLGSRSLADDTVIGSVFAWVLGLGALFLSIYSTDRSGGGGGNSGVSVLFGSIFGITSSQAVADTLVAVATAAAVVVIARPLLFASFDTAVAEARGVPVRLLGYVFFVAVGITAGAATQAVGSLLLLGLVATPGGAAQRLTARPFSGLGLSAAIGILAMWTGLALAYAYPQLPPSFAVVAVATAIYLGVFLLTAERPGGGEHRRGRPVGALQGEER